jgi:hypothetical protein
LFCPLAPICLVPETILKSNTVQLKLSNPIGYFLADQTHPIMLKKNYLCSQPLKYIKGVVFYAYFSLFGILN